MSSSITDTDRMDWLVSMHVEVRLPLVYGSRPLFVAEDLADEDEQTRTDLREQIDRTMIIQKKLP